MMNKALQILLRAILEEYCFNNVDDLLVFLAKQGIKISVQVASDMYYNYQWKHRQEIKYQPLENDRIKVPATDVKKRETNKYC